MCFNGTELHNFHIQGTNIFYLVIIPECETIMYAAVLNKHFLQEEKYSMDY